MRDSKILITGGAGFIGTHLVEYFLNQNYTITVLDNCTNGCKIPADVLSKINFIEGDVRDYAVVKQAVKNVDYIVHLAALVGVEEVILEPMKTIETETLGTLNLIKAVSESNVKKIIYASSSAVYKNSVGENSSENDPLFLVNDYAVAKRTNEIYLNAFMAEKGIPTVSIRLFNIYGCYQDARMVIPRFFQQAKNNAPIKVFGDGSQIRDFTIIDDVMTSIDQLLLHSDATGIFNIARGKGCSIKKLAFLIKEVSNSSSEIIFQNFPEKRLDYKVEKRIGNADKLFDAIGFRPSCSVEDGLRKIFTESIAMSGIRAIQH